MKNKRQIWLSGLQCPACQYVDKDDKNEDTKIYIKKPHVLEPVPFKFVCKDCGSTAFLKAHKPKGSGPADVRIECLQVAMTEKAKRKKALRQMFKANPADRMGGGG